jgi:phosphoglycolate phosphatase
MISECNGMAPVLVLDLDGTLVDSLPDLAAALNRLLASRGLGPLTMPAIGRMVGDGTPTLIARGFAAHQREPDAKAVADFMADYLAHVADETRPYPEVAATLDGLQKAGWRFAVCTNKPEAAAHAVLRTLSLDHYFATIGGGDSFPTRKPDPAHLRATLERAGGSPGQAVMAGDHLNDVKAAHGAGLPCIFAAWGYGAPEMGEAAEARAARFADLPPIAEALLTAARSRSASPS